MMNTRFTMKRAICALPVFALLFAACNKDQTNGSKTPSTSSAIVVLASASGQQSDSVYIVNSTKSDEHRESTTQSALPATVSAYLTANYQASTFNSAYTIKNSTGATTGYVVVLYFNDRPVALRFDASGNFVAVLEQREKGDLNNSGYHTGGRFEDRDGQHRDSLSLTSVPLNITTYLLANYSRDTLSWVFRDHAGNIILISRNNGAFATIFNSSGVFVTRVALNSTSGYAQPVDQASLSANINTYLSTTYPNYVFEKAYAVKQGTTTTAYVVIINANNTKYAVEFNAGGSFVRSKTIY